MYNQKVNQKALVQKKMSKLIITRGLPASGKSTWAKYWVPKRELLVQHIQEEALIEALLKGYDIVIDNTNLNKKVLDNYRALVIAHGNHAIEFKDFFDTPLSVCIERDKNRDLQVTERVIRSFYNNYKDKYPLNGN